MKTKMSPAMFASIAAFATSQISYGSLLLYEPFDYAANVADGGSITGESGGTGGWTGAWISTHEFTSTGLTYTDSNGDTLVTSGGAIEDPGPSANLLSGREF